MSMGLYDFPLQTQKSSLLMGPTKRCVVQSTRRHNGSYCLLWFILFSEWQRYNKLNKSDSEELPRSHGGFSGPYTHLTHSTTVLHSDSLVQQNPG